MLDLDSARKHRPANQLWVYFEWEAQSQPHTAVRPEIDGEFNLTMTHRFDSDIWAPYGSYRKLATPKLDHRNSLSDVFKRKTAEAIWLVSHWNTFSQREQLAQRLARNGIKISIFGQNCPTSISWATCLNSNNSDLPDKCRKVDFHSPKQCNQEIGNRYKFYFAFENTLCNDYVTEKLYNFLQLGTIIPVVYNAANMSRYAPPNSFINVADFENAEQLAEHLHRVGNDEKLYTSYLKWFPQYEIEEKYYERTYTKHFCTLCEGISKGTWTNGQQQHTYQSVNNWFQNKQQCYKANNQFI